jgi:selenocysteine-specific elongation factor
MTVVLGTAGHIDHGKTALLKALTGIDADRLPEERRRGMTIDVGYAHLAMPDGGELDFVDVPGHDRLVGNMLVGAGEIDGVLLVVAADDGPRAQTLEHLALLDCLGLRHGLAVVTKCDLVEPGRVDEVTVDLQRLLRVTTLSGISVLATSSATGDGIDRLRMALADLRDQVEAARHAHVTPASRLAVDRVFAVRGRGTVVTGTLRGDPVTRGGVLRLVPGERPLRVRGIQVHGRDLEIAGPGRTAFNLAGVEVGELQRGAVLTSDDTVVASRRLLVALDPSRTPGDQPLPRDESLPGDQPGGTPGDQPLPPDRTRARLHLGTAQVEATVGRSGRVAVQLADGREIAVLRLDRDLAAAPGDRFVLRRPPPRPLMVGGAVLEPRPAAGVSRKRQSPERLRALADAIVAGSPSGIEAARLALHGAVGSTLAHDVRGDLERVALKQLAAAPADASVASLRGQLGRWLRRRVSISASDAGIAADRAIASLVGEGTLERAGDRIGFPGRAVSAEDPRLAAAKDRLVDALAVAAPPPLDEAARATACPADAVRALERDGRIVVLAPDLAYAAPTFLGLAQEALRLAGRGPVSPAAYRDATGTSRKYVMAILEELDRRGVLRRTPAGHVPGPRAASIGAIGGDRTG